MTQEKFGNSNVKLNVVLFLFGWIQLYTKKSIVLIFNCLVFKKTIIDRLKRTFISIEHFKLIFFPIFHTLKVFFHHISELDEESQ